MKSKMDIAVDSRSPKGESDAPCAAVYLFAVLWEFSICEVNK